MSATAFVKTFFGSLIALMIIVILVYVGANGINNIVLGAGTLLIMVILGAACFWPMKG